MEPLVPKRARLPKSTRLFLSQTRSVSHLHCACLTDISCSLPLQSIQSRWIVLRTLPLVILPRSLQMTSPCLHRQLHKSLPTAQGDPGSRSLTQLIDHYDAPLLARQKLRKSGRHWSLNVQSLAALFKT